MSRPGSPSRPDLGSVSQASEADIPWLLSQPLGVVCGQSPRDEWPHYLACRNCSPSLCTPHLLFTFMSTLYNGLTLQSQVTSALATHKQETKVWKDKGTIPRPHIERPEKPKEKLMPGPELLLGSHPIKRSGYNSALTACNRWPSHQPLTETHICGLPPYLCIHPSIITYF